MGARRIFSKGVQTQRQVNDCRSYLSSVYLLNTNTCCRISLCRIESDSDSVSDSMHDYCSEKSQKPKSRRVQVHLLAPACGRPWVGSSYSASSSIDVIDLSGRIADLFNNR